MKKIIFALSIFALLLVQACNNNNSETPTPDVTCLATKITEVGDDQISFNFDANKRLTSMEDKEGYKAEFVYTDNRVSRVRFLDLDGTPYEIHDYTYNAQGQITKWEVRLTETGDVINSGDYTHGTSGANTTITAAGSSGQESVYEFNSDGYLIGVGESTYTYGSNPPKTISATLNLPFIILSNIPYSGFTEGLEFQAFTLTALPTEIRQAGISGTFIPYNYTNVTQNEQGFVTGCRQAINNSATNYTDFTFDYDCQ